MYKVICLLPNASTNISGIDFEEVDGVMVAVDVSEDDALRFGKVPGFEVIPQEGLENLLNDSDADGNSEETNATDGFNYAELTVEKIKGILEQDPELHERVLADEVAQRGDNTRDGVVNACEAAKQSLNGGE